MSNVRRLLEAKGNEVWSISPEFTVFEALQMMAEKEVGALVVLDGEKLVGVFSERDYARKVALKERSSRNSPVRDMMTAEVICVSPDGTVDDCMKLMTAKRVRHLPVMEEEKLVGIVSIGDVVKKVISDQEFTIQELEKYIVGGVYRK